MRSCTHWLGGWFCLQTGTEQRQQISSPIVTLQSGRSVTGGVSPRPADCPSLLSVSTLARHVCSPSPSPSPPSAMQVPVPPELYWMLPPPRQVDRYLCIYLFNVKIVRGPCTLVVNKSQFLQQNRCTVNVLQNYRGNDFFLILHVYTILQPVLGVTTNRGLHSAYKCTRSVDYAVSRAVSGVGV